MAKTDSIQSAYRLAKAIASDIAIYNVAKIEQALQDDNIFDVLADELDEGRAMFRNKVANEIVDGTNIFQKAVIDVILASRANINTPIW